MVTKDGNDGFGFELDEEQSASKWEVVLYGGNAGRGVVKNEEGKRWQE